jgi:3-hydroxymyristoyl/3-hydroxydecanoyl-(acyl carrier protein) dehydratase
VTVFDLVTAIDLDLAARPTRGRAHVPAAPWLADHFPGDPIVPATVLLEIAAQIAGPLVEELDPERRSAVLGLVRSAVFRTPVRFPADLAIDARVVRADGATAACRVDIAPAMSAELGFALVAAPEASPARTERQRRLARWQAAWLG